MIKSLACGSKLGDTNPTLPTEEGSDLPFKFSSAGGVAPLCQSIGEEERHGPRGLLQEKSVTLPKISTPGDVAPQLKLAFSVAFTFL